MTITESLPFVSVIIPAYNEELYIQACLKSVLEQDYPLNKYEVLLVDNGSTDNTSQIAEKILAKGSRGIVLHKAGGTIASVRNFGWSNAQGEFLAFLDGDSVVEPGWLKEAIKLLNSSGDISCVGFTAASPLPEDSWVERTWFPISSSGKHHGTISVNWLSSFNLVVRKDFFEQVGGFDEALITCEDVDLGNRLSSVSRLLFSDKCHVRHLGGAKTIKDFVNKEYWRGQNNLRSFWKSHNKISEIFSVIAPVIYLSMIMIFFLVVFCILLNRLSFIWGLMVLLILVLIPLLLSIRAGIRSFKQLISTSTIYMLYLLARGVAIVNFR